MSASKNVSSIFIEDRKGDQQNLTYGSSNRHAIPRYRAAGHGRIIGLAPNLRIISRSDSELRVEDSQIDSSRTSRKPSLLSSITDDTQAVKVRSRRTDHDSLGEDFREFNDKRRSLRSRRPTTATAGNVTVEDESDSHDLSSEDEPNIEDAFEVFKKDPTHQRNLELTRATEVYPGDPVAWLALIDFQPRLLEQNRGSLQSKSLSELKLALYEQALSKVKVSDGRRTLILGLMQEAATVWEADKQASKWETFLAGDFSFDLWKLYINFTQTSPVKFSFEECLKVYMRWLQKLREAPPDKRTDSSLVYILLRLTLFLWQSGFTERATGVWQAVLEWNFFSNPDRQLHMLDQEFREFWAREVARIGEEGSRGWSSNVNPELDPPIDPLFEKRDMNFEEWASAETRFEENYSLPVRYLDDISDEDPHRVVLFTDVQELLFRPVSEKGRLILVDAFLLFAGLPPVSSLTEVRAWTDDPFISRRSPAAIGVFQASLQIHRRFTSPARYEDVSLAAQRLASTPSEIGESFPQKPMLPSPQFVRKVILQLAELSRDGQISEDMMEYAVAFEAGIDSTGAKKLAKSFLKSKGNNLRLYNAYALLEIRQGHFQAAVKVWSAALSMRMSFDNTVRLNEFLLWRDWVLAHLTQGEFDQAQALISQIMVEVEPGEALNLTDSAGGVGSAHPSSAAAQIKVDQYLELQMEIAGSTGRQELLKPLTDLLAYHRYLNRGMRLEVILPTFETVLGRLEGMTTNEGDILAAIHEQRGRFMYAHAVHFQKSFRPRQLSDLLAESVRRFPSHLDLLLLQHYFSQRAGVTDRLHEAGAQTRSRQKISKQESVIPCIFDVLVELNRPSYSGSTDHSIRMAFKRATEIGSPGHNSENLWKDFIRWEISDIPVETNSDSSNRKEVAWKRDRGARAVEAVYASLRACPWSKDLCMLSFREPRLRDSFDWEELRQMYQSVLDRGLRLHIDISDRLG